MSVFTDARSETRSASDLMRSGPPVPELFRGTGDVARYTGRRPPPRQ
jgi:hypothetical protein